MNYDFFLNFFSILLLKATIFKWAATRACSVGNQLLDKRIFTC
jgi:hypothetical protein